MRGIVINLTITLLLVSAVLPLAQATTYQIPQVVVHQERYDVYRFEEYIPLGVNGTFYKVNVYVIDKPDGLLLIDCGAEDLYELLISKISEVFGSKQIIAVLLTHGHADHAGAGSKFLQDGVAIYAPIGDKDMIENGNNYTGVPEQFTYTGYTPTGFLQDGDEIYGLKVIATPGHTAGSICFYNQAKKALFSGDTTIAYAKDDLPTVKDLTFELEFATLLSLDRDSLNQQLNSLNQLLNIRIKALFPGHNKAYYGWLGTKLYILHSIGLVKLALSIKS